MRIHAIVAMAALEVATAGSARAEAKAESELMEFVVPDLRVEFGDRATSIVLAFPLAVALVNWDWGMADVWIEPQYRDNGHELRAVGGARITLGRGAGLGAHSEEPGAIFVEAGGLVGTDGNGVMVGGGLSMFQAPWGSVGSVVYRATFAGGPVRHDVSLDFVRFELQWW